MRLFWLFGLLLFAVTLSSADGQEILGSGSTLAYPVLARWSEAYAKINGVHLIYQPIGSTGGIREIRSDVVDVGITDAPLDDASLLRDGLAQFPVVIGAIVPVVNLDGIAPGQLHFTGRLLADIFVGKVKNWRDAAIAAVNPGLKLPDRPILVIYRSDGSGTTYNWADYLSKVSDEWRVKVGINTLLAWPTGVSAKGSGGVVESVARVKGAIGFVEYSYALHSKLSYGLVQNRAGKFVPPSAASLLAATEGMDWEKQRDFYVSLNDAAGAGAYPIVAISFALIRRYPIDAARSLGTRAFFRWTMENGKEVALALGYLPLPPPLVRQVEAYWAEQIRARQ